MSMRSDGSSGNDAVNVLSFRRLGTQKPHARNFERIEPPEGPKRLRQGSGVCLQSTAHRLMAGDSMDARCRLGRLGSLRGFLPLAVRPPAALPNRVLSGRLHPDDVSGVSPGGGSRRDLHRLSDQQLVSPLSPVYISRYPTNPPPFVNPRQHPTGTTITWRCGL